MDQYIFICGPPGTQLRRVKDKLRQQYKNKVSVQDVEDVLTDLDETEKALDDVNASYQKISMYEVTWCLPRSKVRELWKLAVKKCLDLLLDSKKPIKILFGHLIYYCGQRNEFYSVVNTKSLFLSNKFSPSHLVLLIDDLYDMYFDLVRESQLFSIKRIPSALEQICKKEKANKRKFYEDKEVLTLLCIGWELRTLMFLLSWRHLESILAEEIVINLDLKFLIYAVKQLTKGLIGWLEDPKFKTIYLSHLITEMRRHQKKGKWPEEVYQINRIQKFLLDKKILLLMPTAIDELRFGTAKRRGNLISSYTGYLRERWPLIEEDETQLLYCRPVGAESIDYKNLIRPKYWEVKEKSLAEYDGVSNNIRIVNDTFIRTLTQEIENQVSARDHLFVSHVDGLLIFRPLCLGRSEFSSGVEAEIDHWDSQVHSGILKRAVFVHFYEDVDSILRSKKRNKIHDEFEDIQIKIIKEDYPSIDEEIVKELIVGNDRETTLSKGKIPPNVKTNIIKRLPDIKKEARIRLLRIYLTSLSSVTPDSAGIWILENYQHFEENLPFIIDFLRKGLPTGNNWEKDIDKFLPEALV